MRENEKIEEADRMDSIGNDDPHNSSDHSSCRRSYAKCWVNFEALQRFGNRVCEIFAESPYLDSERCVCLSSALDQRIERLEGLALTMNHEQHHSPKIEEEFEIKL